MKVFTKDSIELIRKEVESKGLIIRGDKSNIKSYITIHDTEEIITLYKVIDHEGINQKPIRISWANIGAVEEYSYTKFSMNFNKIIEIAKFIKNNIKIEDYTNVLNPAPEVKDA